MEFGGLRNSHAVYGDATLTEERVQEINRHRSEIGFVQICALNLGQFTSILEFYV